MVDLLVECTVKEPTIKLPPAKKSKHKGFNITDVLTLTSDMDFIDFRRIPYVVSLSQRDHADPRSQNKITERKEIIRGHCTFREAQPVDTGIYHIRRSSIFESALQ